MTSAEVLVLQTAPTPGEVHKNVEELMDLVRSYARPGDVVVTPELSTTGYEVDLLRRRGNKLAQALDGPVAQQMRALASERHVTLVIGLLEKSSASLPFNTTMVIDPAGLITPYRKTHLHPTELDLFEPGDSATIVDTEVGRLGMMICFEHGFPELATTLAVGGADVFVIPSAVPFGYEYLLELRTRARAQDNQIFAVACNMAGNGFAGGSCVVDPRGDIIVSAGTTSTHIRATLDLQQITSERAQEPTLVLRRPEIYAAGQKGPM